MAPPPKDSHFDLVFSFFVSFLAWPVVYVLNNGFEMVNATYRPAVMMTAGFGIMVAICVICAKFSKMKSWIGLVFMLFLFTCMIDLIIALEYHGHIKGFMWQYLELGEPYLDSPWGSAITFFDGLGLYVMYLAIIHRISNGKNWHTIGIYWVSAIINSMIVLLMGVATGKHSPTFCTFLNIPYVVFPCYVLYYLLRWGGKPNWINPKSNAKSEASRGEKVPDLISARDLTAKIRNLGVIIGFIGTIFLTITKAFLSLGSTFCIFKWYTTYDPSLMDTSPAPFAKIQSLVLFFYTLPLQVLCLFYSCRATKPQYLWDLAVVNAGIFHQAIFTTIMTALDTKAPAEFRADIADPYFWSLNMLLVLVPHAFLVLLYERHRLQKPKKN